MKNRDKLVIGSKILASKITNKPRPFFVQYSLLNACNAKCVYCNCPERDDPRASNDAGRRQKRRSSGRSIAAADRHGGAQLSPAGLEPADSRDRLLIPRT